MTAHSQEFEIYPKSETVIVYHEVRSGRYCHIIMNQDSHFSDSLQSQWNFNVKTVELPHAPFLGMRLVRISHFFLPHHLPL